VTPCSGSARVATTGRTPPPKLLLLRGQRCVLPQGRIASHSFGPRSETLGLCPADLRIVTTTPTVCVPVLTSYVSGAPVDGRKLRRTVTQVPGSKCHHRSWLHSWEYHLGGVGAKRLDRPGNAKPAFSLWSRKRPATAGNPHRPLTREGSAGAALRPERTGSSIHRAPAGRRRPGVNRSRCSRSR
jgi:hypothetical protein